MRINTAPLSSMVVRGQIAEAIRKLNDGESSQRTRSLEELRKSAAVIVSAGKVDELINVFRDLPFDSREPDELVAASALLEAVSSELGDRNPAFLLWVPMRQLDSLLISRIVPWSKDENGAPKALHALAGRSCKPSINGQAILDEMARIVPSENGHDMDCAVLIDLIADLVEVHAATMDRERSLQVALAFRDSVSEPYSAQTAYEGLEGQWDLVEIT